MSFSATCLAKRTKNSVSVSERLQRRPGLAMDVRNAAAAVQAIMGKAKLHGLLVDRTQIEERPYVRFQMIAPA